MTLTQILQIIRSAFYTKAEIDSMGGGTNLSTTISNKANDSDVVHKSGNETVGGMKTFTDNIRVTRITPDITLNISDCDVTEIPTEAKSGTLYFRDKNYKNLSYIVSQHRANGQNRMCYRTHRTDNINNYYSVDLDSDGNFYPEQNKAINLGIPAFKWKSLNGVNIGALSLPSTSDNVDVTSQVVNNNGIYKYTNNKYDGWIVITAFADNVLVNNNGFECRSVRGINNAVTTHISLRLNETVFMRFTNFTNFAYVKLYKCLGNV